MTLETRTVGRDYTIAWNGKQWRIDPRDARPNLSLQRIAMEESADGNVTIRLKGRRFRLIEIPRSHKPDTQLKAKGSSSVSRTGKKRYRTPWRDFNLSSSPPLWTIIRREGR